MRQKSMTTKKPAEKVVRDIRRRTRRQYSSEEKIRIVLEGLRGEESIAARPVPPCDQALYCGRTASSETPSGRSYIAAN